MKILIVEDEPTTAKLLREGLELAGYQASVTPSAEVALQRIQEAPPDLVLLDINLAGISGFDLCSILRKNAATNRIPIVMLTSHSRESDKVAGLQLGADDYVTKPFSERELLARIEAVLRRAQGGGAPETVYQCGDLAVNLSRREATVKGKAVDLTPLEFGLLAHFLQHKGRAHTYQGLADAVWGENRLATRHTVSVTVSRLREKLGAAGDCIEPLPGIGYKLSA